MRTLIHLTLFVVIFLVLSCQSKEESISREDRLSKGNALIDAGRFEEAIVYFNELIKTDSHPHVKLALASAHAAKAGVRIEQIYSFVVVRSLQVEPIQLSGYAIDLQTQNLMHALARYAAQWERIPNVDIQGRESLAQALDVLNTEELPGARLYAVTLRVVLLKSVIEEGLQGWSIVQSRKVCSDHIRPYFYWSLDLLANLILIAQDLQLAYPERSAEFVTHEQNFKRIKNEIEDVDWPQRNLCF